jgi:RNA polymerase sigma-70 factor, ECF subfamily
MTEVQDVELLERARRGDEDAFVALFARYERAIYRYAAYTCGREAADDVVQDTFLVILKQGGRLDPPRAATVAYLLGIARHVALKRLTGRGDHGFDEPLGDDTSETTPSGEMTTLDQLTRQETIDAVRAAVQSLPLAYREVVVLCELQELDYAEAASIVQCPVGTVRSRLHRARALLASKLAARERPVGAAGD